MTKGARIAAGRTAEVFAWNDRQVLKLFREWCPRTWAEQEARIARVVHKSALPVPAVGGVVEIEGRMGIIYERVTGPSMLREFISKPWRLPRFARLLGELHASIHVRHVSDLPSQRRRLQREIDSTILPQTVKDAALAGLSSLPDGNVLCHGDFHPDNILMSDRGPIIIDWPVATQGNPLADVARTLLLFRLAELPPGTAHHWLLELGRTSMRRIYPKQYIALRGASKRDIDAWRLPVAVARASEEIAAERHRLQAYIDALLHETA